MSKKQQWSQEEKELLIQLTQSDRENKYNIDWEKVAANIKNRTASQCKSYYANIIKPSIGAESRQNHMWTKKELISLYVLGVNYSSDFECVRNADQMFQHFTVKQLASQWHQILKKQQLFLSYYRQIEENPNFITTLGRKDFHASSFVVKVGYDRKFLVQLQYFQRSTQQTDDKGYPLDVMEIKAIEQFFQNLNIDNLYHRYQLEHERRGEKLGTL
ncbi:Myb-like_DNA-binding domain-containing protein [Hexamita inflata]|uniref:Myb-like DNA-binding domain-containing protein n=1 Tax=Hexamita inflata TaxID=28002 RepID=A0AA86VBS2_9EUKA|nr:Myb-like DNA-binding domain-containing protein [Hexamita inflata]